jgi:hypothetical protein
MGILKLKNGKHNAISGTIADVSLTEPGKYGSEYKVEFTSGDVLFVNKAGFERQVARLKKLPNEMEGETVTFSKKAMDGEDEDGKGYLNVDIGASAPKKKLDVPNDDHVGRDLRNSGVPLAATTYDAIKDKYVSTLADAFAISRDAEETMGVAFSASDVLSLTATLFIERNKRGV